MSVFPDIESSNRFELLLFRLEFDCVQQRHSRRPVVESGPRGGLPFAPFLGFATLMLTVIDRTKLSIVLTALDKNAM